MKRSQKLMQVVGGLMIVAVILAACAPPATPTPEPIPTDVPVAEFEAMSVSAPSCDYGGEFQTIEAVDESTVKFTLCYPDPAFPSKVAFSAYGINDSGQVATALATFAVPEPRAK